MIKLTATSALLLFMLTGCKSEPLIDIVTPEISPASSSVNTTTAGLYDITTFDVYQENNNIHVLAGGKAHKTDKSLSLRYLFSTNGGNSWSKPVTLGKNLPTTIATRGNDIQLAASGQMVFALWQSKGELPGMGPLNSAFSKDGGKTWEGGINPAINNQGDQSHADVLVDKFGNIHSVWLEDPEENGYQSLRYTQWDTATMVWRKPRTLDDSTCSCCWNTLSLASDNTVNILYRDMKPRDMALLTSTNAGKSWQTMGRVGEFDWQFDGCPHNGGGLTAVPEKPTHYHSTVWTGEASKAGLYYLRSINQGKTWTAPQKMGNNAMHSDIAALDENHIAAVWDELQPDGSQVFYAISTDGGQHWPTPQAISSKNVSASHPRIVALNHNYVVLWTEKSNKAPNRLAWHSLEGD